MRDALAEARLALPAGDVPVGAVVLDAAGSVVARGHNVREALADPTGHAEMVALREAAAAAGEWRLSGHTLVVTLEPCTMCAGAAVLARVDRVVREPPPARGGCSLAQGHHLGVAGRVAERLPHVVAARHHGARGVEDDGTDRHVTGGQGQARLCQRVAHGRLPASVQ